MKEKTQNSQVRTTLLVFCLTLAGMAASLAKDRSSNNYSDTSVEGTSLNQQEKVVRGKLTVDKTGEPLPFATIGVPGKNLGTISRPDGSYAVNLSEASATDSLVFSTLGYERKAFLVSDLQSSQLDVQLKPQAIVLQEVTITRKKDKPVLEKIGRYKPSKTTRGQSGIKEFGFGGEYGILIKKHEKVYEMQDVNFHMRFNSTDSILFRINIYSVADGLPSRSILDRDLFVTSKRGKKWISKDVTDRKIIVDRDLFISFEVIRIWYSDSGQNNIFYTYGSAYPEGGVYLRRSSMDRWILGEPDGFPITLYVTGSIYDTP